MLRVGHIHLHSNLLLAPIAGYCDLAFRTICREFGGLGLACTDLLSPQGLLRGTATSLDLAKTNAFDKPVGMQLYGGDPAIMADGALWARDHGATIIDINMGCPVDKVTKKDGGSKLLCIPDTAEKVVERVVAAVGSGPNPIPVTCKMRLGWFNCEPVAETLAPRLIRAGAAMITIHGRTTEQKFQGVVNHEGIRRVVEAVKSQHPTIPVIGNGDVTEPHHVLEMIQRTGCDGVMIGRGALSTPWIFRDAFSLQTTGRVPLPPDQSEIIATIRHYFDLMREHRDDRYAMFQIRRRISWFAKRLGRQTPHTPGMRPALGPNPADDSELGNPADRLPRTPSVRSLREAVRVAPAPADVYTALDAFARGDYPGVVPDNSLANDVAPANAEAAAA